MNKSVDTVIGTRRFLTVQQQNIPAADNEKYSTYTANLKRVEYKLSYNTSSSANSRLFTWNELAKRAYGIYGVYTEKELKKLMDL